ncbi:MAG TPA: hypothetical protein DDZ51_11910 [Planctomycetaceae bacterium]|nr:hypothetical protein [Planctomycetaceae bacterium]
MKILKTPRIIHLSIYIMKKAPYLLSTGLIFFSLSCVNSGNADETGRPAAKTSSNAADKSLSRLSHVSTTIITSAEDSQVARNYSGTVVAKRTSELGFKRVGRIVRLQVDQGDLVEENELICELETAQIEAQIAILRAQRVAAMARLDELKAGPRKQTIEVAKAQLIEFLAVRDQSKSTFERRNRLANSDAISTQDIDDSRHQLAAADARVAAQREIISELEEGTRKEQIAAQVAEVARLDASLDALTVEIDESQLRAPFKGYIAKRFLDEGAIVQPGQAIYRLIEANVLEAFIGLPIDAASNLDATRKYTLSVGGDSHSATLKAVLPELDAGTRTRTAIFTIDPEVDSDGSAIATKLAPGQIIQLRLEQKINQEGFWLPISALTKSINGLWSIYVVQTEKGGSQSKLSYTVQRTDVEIVQIDTARVLVRGAIKEGERVVIDGVQKITPGQQVSFADTFGGTDLAN